MCSFRFIYSTITRSCSSFWRREYQLNKVNFWNEEEENKNQLLLSQAWLNLSKLVKNKLGVEDSRGTVFKFVNYLNKNSGLKWGLIIFAFYVVLFVVIGLLNFFNN